MTTPPDDDLTALSGGLRAAEATGGDDRLVLLCLLAGRNLALDERDVASALRRSELLLAAGGDPRRALELHGRAVTALAEDLDRPERRAKLASGLATLAPAATGLAEVTAALERLTLDADLAWQCYAMARLAEHLADDA
ncbi:MAG: hypothetical protein LH654_07070 [Thermoleophilia bacterium]|nr:hypothetical protein [Thermoleophilia bacterium]